MKANLGENLFNFFTSLKIDKKLPNQVEILNPYKIQETVDINKLFYDKYYSDNNSRILLYSINPGRFGAGITGIAFTDPVVLENNLQIENRFQKKPELSATFVHEMINAYGGPENFYNSFLMTNVSPLGFIQNGVNINYYDDKDLQKALIPFIKKTIKEQFEITGGVDVCGCIGQGKNLKFLQEINNELKLYKNIVPLPHPRWVMQYRRKQMDEQIGRYLMVLKDMLRT